ncbi:MAG: hypothetical protein GEV03_10370 [Streptosporangiales bacterium]|nr:hypothetical protein [Streptosporangiales bacterium]
MCTWITERAEIAGSGKGPNGWFTLTHTNVYYDHPYHATFDHTLNIDFVNEADGPGARVAVELTADSARALVQKIQAALASGDAQHQRSVVPPG